MLHLASFPGSFVEWAWELGNEAVLWGWAEFSRHLAKGYFMLLWWWHTKKLYFQPNCTRFQSWFGFPRLYRIKCVTKQHVIHIHTISRFEIGDVNLMVDFFFVFFCAQHQWSSILHRAGATNYPKLPSFHQLAKSEEGTWLQSLLMSKHSVWEGHPNCQKCQLSNSCSLLPSNIIALLLPSNIMFTVT